jgi:transposase
VHLDLIDRHTTAIEEITGRIEVVIEPFQGFRDLICTIPGIGPSPPTSSSPKPALT